MYSAITLNPEFLKIQNEVIFEQLNLIKSKFLPFVLIVLTLRYYYTKYFDSGFYTNGTKDITVGQVKFLKALSNLAMFSVVEALRELRFGP